MAKAVMTKFKLNKAGVRELLKSPEIAAECGIQDVNYFIKLFKKQTGFTPSRYRSQGNHSDAAQ